MATFSLRRFSHVEVLRRVSPEHMRALLKPFGDFLGQRGYPLPESPDTELAYDTLARIFARPDSDTPPELAEALYLIDEMATPEGMDALLNAASRARLDLDLKSDSTPEDVALQVYLTEPSLLRRHHAQHYWNRPRSFESFLTGQTDPVPTFTMPRASTLSALEQELDDWFQEKKRGRGCRVHFDEQGPEVWILVWHGAPFRREGSVQAGEPDSVYYRPEQYDVLVYDQAIGELRIHAGSIGEKKLYRKAIGEHLFGDGACFPDTGKYTLEPLRQEGRQSLLCEDIVGLDWIRLREVALHHGGQYGEVEIRKADDLFAALADRGTGIPTELRLLQARFQVKFADSKKTRSVLIRPPNVAHYTRDSDSHSIETWLRRRRFVTERCRNAQPSLLASA